MSEETAVSEEPETVVLPEDDQAQTESDPYAEQFKNLNDKFDGLQKQLVPEPEPPASLYDGISAVDDAEIDTILNDEDSYEDDGDVDIAAFDNYVDQRVQEALAPYQENENRKELNALGEKYPDIIEPEIFGPVSKFLKGLVDRHQNENLATDPAMVEAAYKSVKAQMASDGEVTAESAATKEATLETGAGPSQQGGADEAEQYIRGMRAAASKSTGAF